MITRAKDLRHSADSNLRGGDGVVEMIHFLEKDGSFGTGRVFSVATLVPGSSIGRHVHEGEFEIYYILKGTAHVMDNDVPGVLETGDVMICKDGDSHCIENRGNEDLIALFIVLYTK